MSREIKFRVWAPIGRKFLYSYKGKGLAFSSSREDSTMEQCGCYDLEQCLSFDFIVQQFTGLKDIKDREIYEGDLVNFHTPGHPHGPEREDFTNEEVWHDDDSAAFVFGKLYYDGWHGYGAYEVKDLEVVGNIFENASLLTENPDKVKALCR